MTRQARPLDIRLTVRLGIANLYLQETLGDAIHLLNLQHHHPITIICLSAQHAISKQKTRTVCSRPVSLAASSNVLRAKGLGPVRSALRAKGEGAALVILTVRWWWCLRGEMSRFGTAEPKQRSRNIQSRQFAGKATRSHLITAKLIQYLVKYKPSETVWDSGYWDNGVCTLK